MANTTFNGPVRSEGGFEQISKTAGTGAITTNLDIDTSGNITTTGYVSSYANVSSITDDTIDLGTAGQGWLVGGIIRLVATSAAVWHCEAFLHGDGTLATPFE
jgi:hypothetical protein